jgi:hypothetical protein
MYGFLKASSAYPFRGLYLESEPTIPMTEQGKVFRYSRTDGGSDERANVVTNLEYRREQGVIRTTDALGWKPEAYVVLGDELWRIILISKRYIETPRAAMIRRPPVEYTLTLDKVNNPVGLERM